MKKHFTILSFCMLVLLTPQFSLAQTETPSVACPGNKTLHLGANCQVILDLTEGVSVKGIDVSQLEYSVTPFASIWEKNATFFFSGRYTVTVTAPSRIEPVQCTYTVDVLDVTPPVITCPASQTVYTAGGETSAKIINTYSITDECNSHEQLQFFRFTNSLGLDFQTGGGGSGNGTNLVLMREETFPLGVNLVTATATDLSTPSIGLPNNTGTCTYTITVVPPPLTVTINKAAGQADPTTSTPVRFTVVFSEEVTGFDASDISFAGSTVPGALVATISGTGSIYTVDVTGFTGAGNVVASVNAGAAINSGGIESLASTSTDNVVGIILFANDLMITKLATTPYVAAGGIVTYEITVARLIGPPSPLLNDVLVQDILPVGTTFIAAMPISWNSVNPILIVPTPLNQNTFSLRFPVFDIGDFHKFRLLVAVAPDLTGSIINTATVSGPLGDVNPVNNSSTATVQIMEPPVITCPGNITVNAEATKCGARVSFPTDNTVTSTGIPAPKFQYKIEGKNGSTTSLELTSFPESIFFETGVNTITVTATNGAGTSTCSFVVTVVDNLPPILTCPSNITVNNDPGKATATVSFKVRAESNCSDDDITITSNVGVSGTGPVGNVPFNDRVFPIGENTVSITATDPQGNTSSCTFTVTVIDNEPPTITCPAPLSVQCTSEIPMPDISTISASDNSGLVTIAYLSDVKTNEVCFNKYTLTRTYKATDPSGNSATCTQVITVNDITPPQITGLTPSKRVLAPPNHKMVPITLDYTLIDNCSNPNVTIDITSNEPVNGTGDGDTDPDWEVVDATHIRLRAERSAQGIGRIYTITVTVNDGCNAPVSATTEVRVTHNITGPQSGNSFKVGSTVAFTGEFWDVPGNTHSAKWLIDGSTTAKGIVTEPSENKNGKVSGSYKFTAPGIYKLQMNTTDQKAVTTYANTNGDVDAIVVIYDPNGGHTYGGGYFNSPAGALTGNSSATGKASYGFAMNYFKNSTNPKGETQFEFKVGEFEFNALNFEYLVISNSMAQFKGTGKIIGGQSGIAFTMTVVDGELDGSGIDKIRMKIYNKNNGKVIYDNQPGASDAALPTQAVGANSTIVIKANSNSGQQAKMETATAEIYSDLAVAAFPNPSASHFSIRINGNTKEKIMMQVVDMYGRVIETRDITAASVIQIGDGYRPGTYFVRVMQGKKHKELKLIKAD